LHTWEKYANEEKVDSGQDAIPTESTFHDILTSFYNIRNSVYEKLKKGKKFIIKTIPEKGHGEISVHILSEHYQEKLRLEGKPKKGDEVLVNITVQKKFSKSKRERSWSSHQNTMFRLKPSSKTILLGDLHARFTHREA
jgi:hypothetical protein